MFIGVPEMAKRIKFPEVTVRNWCNLHPWLAPLKRGGDRGWYIPEPLTPVFSLLGQLMKLGLTKKQAFRAIGETWPTIKEWGEGVLWIRYERAREDITWFTDPESAVAIHSSPMLLVKLTIEKYEDNILDSAAIRMFEERLADTLAEYDAAEEE